MGQQWFRSLVQNTNGTNIKIEKDVKYPNSAVVLIKIEKIRFSSLNSWIEILSKIFSSFYKQFFSRFSGSQSATNITGQVILPVNMVAFFQFFIIIFLK